MPTENKKPKAVLNKEIGESGTILLRGILSNVDYNADLTGTQRISIYDQMRLGDATVKAALQAVKLPIQSTEWNIRPPKGKDDKDEVTIFIRQQLFENENFTFSSFLRKILTFCEYGNSVFEKVYYLTPEGKIGFKKFGQRLSKTIQRWEMQSNSEPGITQLVPQAVSTKGGTLREIPAWKLLIFVLDQEGDNYEGISLLRAAYKHWLMKDTYYKIDALATERQGLGLPKITSPPVANPQDKAKAKKLARNIRANEDAYLDLPTGYNIEFMDMKAKGIKDPEKMIGHHDRQILQAVMAQFLKLGDTSSGSYSVSNTQVEFFYLGEQYVARMIKENIQKEIKILVDLNFSVGLADYPTIEFGQIGKVDWDKLATSLSSLITSGVITPDDDLERHTRNSLDLPASEMLENGEKIERPRAGMPNQPVESEKKKTRPTGKDKKKPAKKKEDKKKIEVEKPDELKAGAGLNISDLRSLQEKLNTTIYAKEKNIKKSKS